LPREDLYPTATDRRGGATCASVLMRGRDAFLGLRRLSRHPLPTMACYDHIWADASLSPLEGHGDALRLVAVLIAPREENAPRGSVRAWRGISTDKAAK